MGRPSGEWTDLWRALHHVGVDWGLLLSNPARSLLQLFIRLTVIRALATLRSERHHEKGLLGDQTHVAHKSGNHTAIGEGARGPCRERVALRGRITSHTHGPQPPEAACLLVLAGFSMHTFLSPSYLAFKSVSFHGLKEERSVEHSQGATAAQTDPGTHSSSHPVPLTSPGQDSRVLTSDFSSLF